MPLTPAHPAAILPLHRWWRGSSIPSALVIGSMGPDFVYYLPVSLDRTDSHTLPALLWFVLPVGLAAYALFHGVMRKPLGELLPRGVRARRVSCPRNETPWSWTRLPWVAFFLVLGGATHLGWDSFTHGGGWFVEHVDFLKARVGEVGQYEIWGYKYLQHGSTLFGLLYLAWWGRRWYSRTPAVELPPEDAGEVRRRRLVVLLVPAAGLVAGLWAGFAAPDKEGWLQHLQVFSGPFVIAGTSTVVVALLVYCLLRLATRGERTARP